MPKIMQPDITQERRAAILFTVALYAAERGAECHETDQAVNAALRIFDAGSSALAAVNAGKMAIAIMTTDKIIQGLML